MARTKTVIAPDLVSPVAADNNVVVLATTPPGQGSDIARVQVAEAWANLIGWKLFGLICLGLMVGEMAFGIPPVLPPWILLALGGAGLGGRELANVILSIFVGAGRAAEAARSHDTSRHGGHR